MKPIKRHELNRYSSFTHIGNLKIDETIKESWSAQETSAGNFSNLRSPTTDNGDSDAMRESREFKYKNQRQFKHFTPDWFKVSVRTVDRDGFREPDVNFTKYMIPILLSKSN